MVLITKDLPPGALKIIPREAFQGAEKPVFFKLQIFGSEYQKMVVISFKDQYEMHSFPKFHWCGSKIMPATPF